MSRWAEGRQKSQSQGQSKHPPQSKFKPWMGTLGLRESHISGVGRTCWIAFYP